MITVLYPYKNKDLIRLHKSIESLQRQTNQDFSILIVDYGSDLAIRDRNIKELSKYDKLEYLYTYHLNQPWSRPRSINIGVKHINTDYVFTADIDMIFEEDFIELLHQIKSPNKSYFFKVGYLSEEDSKSLKSFTSLVPMHFSTENAQGISLFPVQALYDITGLDEYIHFWGADNDIHNRLKNNGLEVVWYNKEVKILHQWHPIYANEEKEKLTHKLQLPFISRINQELQRVNRINNVTKVNNTWGVLNTEKDYNIMHNIPVVEEEMTEVKMNYLLFVALPRLKKGEGIAYRFKESQSANTFKYKLKKVLGKKVESYLSLKEVNDLLLIHLVSFYKDDMYSVEISKGLDNIEFKFFRKDI